MFLVDLPLGRVINHSTAVMGVFILEKLGFIVSIICVYFRETGFYCVNSMYQIAHVAVGCCLKFFLVPIVNDLNHSFDET